MHANKPKVMLHIIMPNKVSGPNTSMKMIASSQLALDYNFAFLVQTYLPGGKFSIKLVRDLYRQIRKYDPDIVHISGLQSAGFHAVVAARVAGYSNIILAIRGFSGDSLKLSKAKRFAFNYFVEPLTILLSRKVYTVCEDSMNRDIIKRLRIYFPRKFIGFIHNAAPEVIDCDNRSNIRSSLGLSEDDIVIYYSGRIVIDKGMDNIVDTIPMVISKYENVKFVIVGEGSYKGKMIKELHSFVKERKVIFLGKREDVKELISAFDIFIFPTLHENLSNSLLEACIARNAIICTDVGGNKEIIKDHFNGLLIKPNDSIALYKSIVELIEDKYKCKEYGDSAYRYAIDNFSQKKLFSRLKCVYDNMMNN